jgi:ABC-2 type transport system ATP-binding protein
VQVGHQTPELIEKLRGMAGITHVDAQADRISIRFEEGRLEVEDLHDFIHDQGARIRMFQPEVMDMETAFMKLTEGQTA